MLHLKNSTIDSFADDPAGFHETWHILGLKPPKASFASNDLLSARIYLRTTNMPYAALERFCERLQLNPGKDASRVFGISAKTLQRRRMKARLDFGESVTVFMAADLLRRAVDIFGGMETAIQWFKQPNRAIRNERPIDLLNDDIGRKIVEDILGRIEHGVYE